MEKAVDSSLNSKPFIKGFLCADSNGLLISARGELDGRLSGRFAAISKESSTICPDQPPPTVLIETETRNVLIRDYDNITVVLSCSKIDE